MSEVVQCECAGAASLGVLEDVAAAYQQRLRLLGLAKGDGLQKKVELLQSWVRDLSEQNALLARTVEELETEFTSRLLLERRRHSEIASELRAEGSVLRRALWRKDEDVRGLLEVLRRLREFDHCSINGIHFHEWDKNKKICDKVNEMKMLNDSLIKENLSKDREIRKLNIDVQHCEQTVIALRNELSNNNYTSEVPKKDAEVTADICCSGAQECSDAEPVRDGALCGTRLQRMDVSIKASGDSVRSLRKLNVSLSEEVRALQRVCGALDEQCRSAGLRARFKDDVIHEMRRQLRQAKAKLKELSESNVPKSQKEHDMGHKRSSYDSLTIACVQRPRRTREPELDCDCPGSVYEESDDDLANVTSTPNTACNFDINCINTGDGYFISPSPPLEQPDGSLQTCVDACSVRNVSDDREVPMEGTSRHVNWDVKPKSQITDENVQENKDVKTFKNNDSTGASYSGSEVEAHTRSLQDSLKAAERALKNKEETVRLQAESLALAEERLASRNRNDSTGYHFGMTDFSTTTELQDNREIVKTLQENLSVIQDLYRECFYETARQDEMIAVLRASCRGVTPAPGVALQVENLKAEISNFLNNSTSNDSGVWEVGELRGVEEQLQRLWAVLQSDCTCGLVQQNMNLKKTNETMETQIHDLRQKVSDLQKALEKKENLNQMYQRQIEEKGEELQRVKDQLSDLKRDSRDQGTACNTLACEIKQLEGLLTDKSEELANIQRQCVSQETIITKLREELEKADANAKENASVRREVWSLTALVAAWRRQLTADARPRHLAQHYETAPRRAPLLREKCSQAEQLRASLRAARAGGAALCMGARAALKASRDGLRALADHARENEEIISQQESLIRTLRERSSKNISSRSIASDDRPCCSKYLHRTETRCGDRSFVDAGETPHSRCASSWARTLDPGESETVDGSPPPAPPRRLLRKKPLYVNRRCQWPLVQEASVCCTPSENLRSTILKREFSADSLLQRVERTHEALELAHRRWCRHEHRHDLPAA